MNFQSLSTTVVGLALLVAPAAAPVLAQQGTNPTISTQGASPSNSNGTNAPQIAQMMAKSPCDIYIGTLTRKGNTLTGRGSQSGCSPSATSYLTMQRSRWYGWEDLEKVTITGPGENYVKYDCTGTGKHEFRVTHVAYTVDGSTKFKESQHHTWSCGN